MFLSTCTYINVWWHLKLFDIKFEIICHKQMGNWVVYESLALICQIRCTQITSIRGTAYFTSFSTMQKQYIPSTIVSEYLYLVKKRPSVLPDRFFRNCQIRPGSKFYFVLALSVFFLLPVQILSWQDGVKSNLVLR